MNYDIFVGPVSRGLIRGFKSLIDGLEFIEGENMTRAEALQRCYEHVSAVIEAQDTVDGAVNLRPDLSLAVRQMLAKSSS